MTPLVSDQWIELYLAYLHRKHQVRKRRHRPSLSAVRLGLLRATKPVR